MSARADAGASARPARAHHRRRRRLPAALLAIVGVVTIGWATLLGVVALSLPLIEGHPAEVADFLGKRLGRPVAFESVRAAWRPQGPVFELERVTLGAGDEAFAFPAGAWSLDFYAFVARGRSFSEFRLSGLDLEARRGDDGRWRVAKLTRDDAPPIDIDRILDLTALVIEGARLSVRDPERALDWRFERVDLRVRNDAGVRLIGASIGMRADSVPLSVACAERARETLACFARGEGLAIDEWSTLLPPRAASVAGELDIRGWFDADDATRSLTVEAKARDLAIETEPRSMLPPALGVSGLNLLAHWSDGPAGARASARVLRGTRETRIGWRRDGDGSTAPERIEAPIVDLGLGALLAPLLARDAAAVERLIDLAPRGIAGQVALERGADGWRGAAAIRDVGIGRGDFPVMLEGLDATVLIDSAAVVLVPARGERIALSVPKMFRETLRPRIDGGTLAAWKGVDATWRFGMAELALEGDGYSGVAAGSVTLGDGDAPPVLDVRVDVGGGRVERARLFWPINAMPPATVRWLDRGLVDGQLVDGAAVFRGPLTRTVMHDGTGRLDASARVANTTLDYGEGWPRAAIAGAELRFVNNSMVVDGATGESAGLVVDRASARIDDFRDAHLHLDLGGHGGGDALLDFLRNSPLQRHLGSSIDGLTLGGRGDVSLTLGLALKPGRHEPELRGEALISDARLIDRTRDFDFGTTNGRVRFSARGMMTDDLSVRFADEPATLALAVGDFVVDRANVAEAELRGEFGAAGLLARVPGAAPLIARIDGRSSYDITLAIARGSEASPARAEVPRSGVDSGARTLTIRSDLVGTKLDLPAPLRKDAEGPLPLAVTLPLDRPGATARFSLGQIVRGRARLAENQGLPSIALAYGVAEVPPLAPEGLVVRGDVAALDVGAWVDLIGALGAAQRADSGARAMPIDVDVRANQLAMIGRAFPETALSYTRRDGVGRVRFEGDALIGTIVVPKPGDSAPVTVDFERIALGDPVPSVSAKRTDPSRLPALRVRARDVRLGTARLGAVSIVSDPIPGGLSVSSLRAESPGLTIHGAGTWSGVDLTERSRFKLELSATDLGAMLERLGFAGVVEGGATRAVLDGAWQGGPQDLKLARFDGTLDVDVRGGRILDVDPGAGRLLGLVSLAEIPRRLSLDFSDFFAAGMAFDSIDGRFRIADGDAWTDALAIRAPAADIAIVGRTGLDTRDYDQRLEVIPRVGGVLPLVGALTAGPAGAAVGALAQGVLGPGIGQMARADYAITGTWEKPEITPIKRVPAVPPSS